MMTNAATETVAAEHREEITFLRALRNRIAGWAEKARFTDSRAAFLAHQYITEINVEIKARETAIARLKGPSA